MLLKKYAFLVHKRNVGYFSNLFADLRCFAAEMKILQTAVRRDKNANKGPPERKRFLLFRQMSLFIFN